MASFMFAPSNDEWQREYSKETVITLAIQPRFTIEVIWELEVEVVH
jgi:hypothetical protein